MSIPTFPHIAIRASAGTGKTHRLTNRFIGLLAAHEQPDRILATTFTRKAAGEILERVLQRLAAAALEPRRCERLASDIGDHRLTSDRSLMLVGQLARNLHRLHARTLDSFFARVARSFALELRLPVDWRIVDDTADAALQAEAVQAVLRDEDPRDLITLVRRLLNAKATSSVAKRVRQLVSQLHALYCETDRAAWHRVPRPKRLPDAELADAILDVAQLPVPVGKRKTPSTKWATGRQRNVDDATRGDWDSLLRIGIAAKIAKGDPSFETHPIDDATRAAYAPILRHAAAVLMGRVADSCEASYVLLEKFDAQYRRLQRAARGLRFDDITRSLAAAQAFDYFNDIYFRLDAEVTHLLLDEFQDTSIIQWEVLQPLATEVTSHGDGSRSFFCVGDLKQAIYGWRGGVAEIFDALEDKLPQIAWEPLDESRRSAPPIIDVVNRVFRGLATNPALSGHADAAAAWGTRFAEHRTARTELAGYVSLQFAPAAADPDDQPAATLAFAADRVQQLVRESPGRTIGVLVRKNKAIARLIFELRQRGVAASEEGGNPLTDSPAVTSLLALLTLADSPGDTIARFTVALSPLGPLVGLPRHDDDEAAKRVAARIRHDLLHRGYGAVLWELTKKLSKAEACDERDLERLAQLVELAHRYESNATLRPSRFVAFVEGTAVEDPVPANVRVMTIHKAKGLQFDITVLPDCDGRLLESRPTVVTGRESPTGRITTVCPYIRENLQALLPDDTRRLFTDWSNRSLREELCVLYVALTRAIHAMHLIVAPVQESDRDTQPSFSSVVRAAVATELRLSAEGPAFEHGDRGWHLQNRLATASSTTVTTAPRRGGGAEPVAGPLVAPPRGEQLRTLPRESPSSLEGGKLVNLKERLRLGNSAAMERGSIFHAWFEQIEWLDDGEPNDDLLRRAVLRLGLARDDLDAMIDEFRGMLRRPSIQATLVRPAPAQGNQFEVWRERPFVIRNGDVVLSGKFDRVVVCMSAGRIAQADVIDFKTDAVAAEDCEGVERATQRYAPQLSAYRGAAARLLGLDSQQVGEKLVFVTAGIVKSL